MDNVQVFISHKHEDEDEYQAVCQALDAKSIRHWSVANMVAGQSLREQLRSAILNSALCIFVGSARSLKSPWCMAELGAFWGSNKPVVILEAAGFSADLLPPQFLGDLRAITTQKMVNDVQMYSARTRILRHFDEREGGTGFGCILSFDKIREKLDAEYTDDFLEKTIVAFPDIFQLTKIRGVGNGLRLTPCPVANPLL